MDISHIDPVERIARVIAAERLSADAEGNNLHAAEAVDEGWRDYAATATAVLKTLREPDARMAAAGDVEIWQRMIAAALGKPPSPPYDPPALGTDPLHEGP